MEITLDVRLVRRIVAAETEQALADIGRLGPVAALESSHRRHDARLSAAPDAHTLACKDGCYWCCYFSVDVRAVEAFGILDFVARELSLAQPQARGRFEAKQPPFTTLKGAEVPLESSTLSGSKVKRAIEDQLFTIAPTHSQQSTGASPAAHRSSRQGCERRKAWRSRSKPRFAIRA